MTVASVAGKTAFVVQLESKHTGETCWLGLKHATLEAALEYIEKEVCKTCNRFSVVQIPADYRWVNRRDGFRRVGK